MGGTADMTQRGSGIAPRVGGFEVPWAALRCKWEDSFWCEIAVNLAIRAFFGSSRRVA